VSVTKPLLLQFRVFVVDYFRFAHHRGTKRIFPVPQSGLRHSQGADVPLQRDSLLAERVERLMTIPAVGPITALTWALEVGDVKRFSSIKKAISYCGLCGAEQSSAGTIKRTPISKQRNKHLQSVVVEAAKMAPRLSSELALIYDREKQRGNANRATLAVARKLVAYLVAIDRSQRNFLVVEKENRAAA
jgi:hypothetical protein